MTAGIWSNSAIAALQTELTKGYASGSEATDTDNTSFMSYLKEALQEVDNLQKDADHSARMLALGEEDYLHNTMIAYGKASLALQLTIEVRNKLLESYQEIMRMQM